MNIIPDLPDKPIEVTVKRYPRLYDYFVDFFGILIPGVTFYTTFMIIITGLIYLISNCGFDICIKYKGFFDVHDYKIEFSVFSIVLSYILGFLFFRIGPQEVDIESVKTNWNKIKDDNPPIDTTTKTDLQNKVQWPYEYLKQYLEVRLPHLAELIPWDPRQTNKKEDNKRFARSKTFMNILKENIRFYLPEKYFTGDFRDAPNIISFYFI